MDKEFIARDIVAGLNDPLSCYKTQSKLIGLGKAAAKPLVEHLLFGPGNEHEPRCLAAEALGIIGSEDAIDGLIAALLNPFPDTEPIKSLVEEAVRNCICHALQRFHDDRVMDSLLTALEKFHLVGAAEALAESKEQRAVPLLIELLEDSFKRWRLSDALLKYGPDAIEALIKTTGLKKTRDGIEILPSAERRAEAVKLLALIANRNVVSMLIELLNDDQPLVKFEVSMALLNFMGVNAPDEVVELIKSSLGSVNLERKLRAEEALCLLNISADRFH